MSCITEILNKKGTQKYLVYDHNAVEDGGIYKNYEWLITFTYMGHRCGYVAIPTSHPLHDKDVNDDEISDLEVHGGISFHGDPNRIIDIDSKCGDIWIGFDAAHAGDGKDYKLSNKLWKGREDINQILFDSYNIIRDRYTIKDREYMQKECEELIDQIALLA